MVKQNKKVKAVVTVNNNKPLLESTKIKILKSIDKVLFYIHFYHYKNSIGYVVPTLWYNRLWYLISNPFYYLFKGVVRY